MSTVHTAKASDIWPNGSGYTREVEDEIIKIARTEISAEDVARNGLVFSQWYIPFYLAEGRWRQRQEQKEQAQVTESANARRIEKIEKKLAQSIDRANSNFKDLNCVIFGEPTDDPNAAPQIIRLIRNIAWDLIHDFTRPANFDQCRCKEMFEAHIMQPPGCVH
jgi:hypothetical protein